MTPTFGEFLRLGVPIGSAHNQAVGVVMVLQQLPISEIIMLTEKW